MTSPSGNGGASHPASSHDPNDIVVGSVSKSGSISSFTQRGPNLNFLAPGEKISLPYYDVGSKKHIYVDSADGTSWSAPHIAGTAALIRQVNPSFSNAQVTAIIKDSATLRYDSATKRSYPSLNLYAAVRLAYVRSGKAVPPAISSAPRSGGK